MSRQVSLDETAIHQATAFLADDPDGLRVGRYRVLYTVTDDLISVGDIARTATEA